MAGAEPGDRFSPSDSLTHYTRHAAADNMSTLFHLAQKMGIFIVFICLIPALRTEEFTVNITEEITSQPPLTESSFTQLIEDLFTNNETTSSSSPSTVETPTTVQTDELEEGNVTSGARRGRLVNGNWDTRELALQFHGSPVFASGFQPILPPPETVVTATEGISIPAVTESMIQEQTGNFEDRILNPFNRPVNSIFIKDVPRKDNGEMGKPSSMFLTGIPPQQQTQESKFSLDSNQVAIAQAAIQAAQSLFGQAGVGQQLTPAAIEQFMASSQTVTENSPWQQQQHQQQEFNDKFFNTGSEPPPMLSVNPPTVTPPPIFRDIVPDNGNKRYGGPQEPFHKYHDLTYSYYAPPPPPPYHPPYHPPPDYHHPPPPPPHHHHSSGGKNILGDVTHLFTDLKRNVVGTAHRFGEKVASIASPHKLGSILPAATTLLVGGLALKFLTSQNSYNTYNNSLPLFTFGRRKRSDYFMSNSVDSVVKGSPALMRKKRELKGGMKLVFEFEPEVEHRIKKRDLVNGSKINSTVSVSSRTDRALDGTFTEDELNNLVTRLDPVQKQFLQKLQWYGFDRWKEMPCAKFILCDVIVHSDYQHIYDLERRIGLFLSLMDDDSARKVEVMIKDLILAIESRDCSQFFCPQENMHGHLSQMPPIQPLPPPVPVHHPTWSNHLPPSYRHPYAFPKSSSGPEST